ncbi:MAG: ribokinase [Candidatus Limnocylindrales bacterium]|jgi:ribokinase
MTKEIAFDPEVDRPRPGLASVEDGDRPIAVVGAHGQSLFMHVMAIPREGETVVAFGFEETVDGGKATNQAVAAARFGAPVRFVSVVGNDERGRRILRYLDEQDIDRRWVEVVDGNTDVGFVMLSPRRIPAIASCQDLSHLLDAQFVERAARAIIGSSIVVCQLEAPPACARAAFELARANGAMTLLNPAPMVPLPPGLLELADVLVPNQHEAAAIVGREAPAAELADRLADIAPWAHVIVTAGEDGAYLGRAGGRGGHIAAPRVQAVDTTGAGDAFVGALAACLRDGLDLVEAATCAVSAAALSVTRPGTLEAFASREMVTAEKTSP